VKKKQELRNFTSSWKNAINSIGQAISTLPKSTVDIDTSIASNLIDSLSTVNLTDAVSGVNLTKPF
jgi:hypothetical protein